MNGNFTFHNPTRLHLGENAMEFLKDSPRLRRGCARSASR